MKNLRILIADDHTLIRGGAKAILQGQPGWKVVGEAVNGADALEMVARLKPDVAIVDLSMPGVDGIQATRQIRSTVPETKVVVLSMHESDQMVQRALEAGARGYILKSDLTESLVKAVKGVTDGKRFLTPKVSEIVLEGFLKASGAPKQEGPANVRATPRELEIIRLLAEGKSNKEVAAQLGITLRTVETHRAKIMLKLGVHSLAELIHYAIRHGIISPQGG